MCSIHLNIESINKHKCTHIYVYIYPYKHKHIHIQNIKTKQELHTIVYLKYTLTNRHNL